jgi:lipopolysaccharide cholinephosphotransferase
LPFAKIRLKDSIYEEPVQVNYKGNKGIWVDIFPLDNANKEDSLFIRFQTFLKESIHFINAIKANVTSEKNPILKKVIKFIFKPISIKKLARLQQKIMKWNKSSNSEYCISFGARYGMKKQTMKKSVFLPTIKLQYEDRSYNAPGNYEFYLNRVYPGYMTLPPEEERVTHNPRRIKFPGEEELKPEEM